MKRLMGLLAVGLFVAASPTVHAWGMGGYGGGSVHHSAPAAPRAPVVIIGGAPGFYERSHQAYPNTGRPAALVSPRMVNGYSPNVTIIGNGGYANRGGTRVEFNRLNDVQARNEGLWEQGRWANNHASAEVSAGPANNLGGGWYRTSNGSLNNPSGIGEQRTYQRQVGGSAAVLF